MVSSWARICVCDRGDVGAGPDRLVDQRADRAGLPRLGRQRLLGDVVVGAAGRPHGLVQLSAGDRVVVLRADHLDARVGLVGDRLREVDVGSRPGVNEAADLLQVALPVAERPARHRHQRLLGAGPEVGRSHLGDRLQPDRARAVAQRDGPGAGRPPPVGRLPEVPHQLIDRGVRLVPVVGLPAVRVVVGASRLLRPVAGRPFVEPLHPHLRQERRPGLLVARNAGRDGGVGLTDVGALGRGGALGLVQRDGAGAEHQQQRGSRDHHSYRSAMIGSRREALRAG